MANISHSESIRTTSVGKYWKSCKMANIGHSESIRTTLVGKYWKSCETAKIGHSESIWTTLVRKYWKSCKTVKIGHSKSIQITFVRSNLDTHLSDTPFAIWQPIWRPRLLERVYKPIHTPHWCGDLRSFTTENTRDRV